MNFNVPQFIEVEDKIAFQLSAKQLGVFALGGVASFFAWTFAKDIFWILFIVIALGCAAFAFLKPNGTTLFDFLLKGFLYTVKPRVLVWQREKKVIQDNNKQFMVKENLQALRAEKADKMSRVAKEEKLKRLENLADILDRKGGL